MVARMDRCWILRAKRNASPSVSTRHTSAATRSGVPSGGTISSRTTVPVFRRALVLTFAPCVLMSTEFDRYRSVPASTTTGQESPVRGCCRRSCCRGLGTRQPRATHVPTHEHYGGRYVARGHQGNFKPGGQCRERQPCPSTDLLGTQVEEGPPCGKPQRIIQEMRPDSEPFVPRAGTCRVTLQRPERRLAPR